MYFTMELNLNNIQPTNQPTKVTLTMLADQIWQPFDRLLITSLLFFKEKNIVFYFRDQQRFVHSPKRSYISTCM